MVSLVNLKNCSNLILPCSNRLSAALSTSCARTSESKGGVAMLLDRKTALMRADEVQHVKQLKEGYITTDQPMDVSLVSGVPEEHIKGRRVRIYSNPKNAMQSGTHNTGQWVMQFDTRERWENPLMGWSSSGDPLSNMEIEFNSPDEAAKFCEKNGWEWYVDTERHVKARAKSYAHNYSWNKRSRVSTK